MTYAFVIACTVAVDVYVLRRLRFDWVLVGLVVAGTLVSGSYLSYTPIGERNYDGSAHVEYIRTLADHLALPPVGACAPCGHPPLYYALAALWSKVVLAGGWPPLELGLQWLSLLLFFGFVVFALVIFRSFIDRPATLRLAAALVVFWPSSIINSVRVHNDALASLLMLAAMYFTARWNGQGRARDFYAALAAAALALLTKATGYATAATLVAFAAWRLHTTRLGRQSVKQLGCALVVLVGAALLATSLRPSSPPLSTCQKVLGGACRGPREPVAHQGPLELLSFDLRQFASPARSPAHLGEDEPFLNRLAGSSLFGVMPLGPQFAGEPYTTLSLVLRLLLLVMLAACALAMPFVRPPSFRRYAVLAATSAIMLVLLVAFRWLLPNPFHEDFRHIFPVLVPLCLVYAKAVEHGQRCSPVLYGAGVAIGVSMAVTSVAFFLLPK